MMLNTVKIQNSSLERSAAYRIEIEIEYEFYFSVMGSQIDF